MSETIEKNQVGDNINIEQPDDNTWNLIIKYVREELSECLDDLPLKSDDPSRILKTSTRLKSLACTLDKLADVYGELSRLQTLASRK